MAAIVVDESMVEEILNNLVFEFAPCAAYLATILVKERNTSTHRHLEEARQHQPQNVRSRQTNRSTFMLMSGSSAMIFSYSL